MLNHRGRGGPGRGAFLLVPLCLIFGFFFLWPLLSLGVDSVYLGQGILHEGTRNVAEAELRKPARPLTLANYGAILADPLYRRALLNSVLLSAAVSAMAIALCLPPAWLLVRREFVGKRVFRMILTLPMGFSGIIIGFLVIVMLGRIGFVPQLLKAITGTAYLSGTAYALSGLVIAYVYFEIPRATLTLEAALRKFNFELEAAARSLGANLRQRLWYVLIPLMIPAILSTIGLTFAVSMGSFGVAMIISKNFTVLPVELFSEITGFLNFELAAAMSVFLAALTFGANYLLRRLAERYYAFQ